MACRHNDDDPACSSYAARQQRKLNEERAILQKYSKLPDSPNPDDYEIEQVQDVGEYLVLKVRYPSCAKCAYEGNKVLVVMATVTDAVRWRRIDPHFRVPGARAMREAPPPIARFPASKDGWEDAIAYAQSKCARRAGAR